ncbi:tail fiber assembly protein, partial [Salmonella enterica]|uniref:tail fiber assembly protein n=1 Tax=Salmonella enterica TaxID=28901 RepID=UPI00398C52F2
KNENEKTELMIDAAEDTTKLFPLNCSVVEFAATDIPAWFQPGKFTYRKGVIGQVQINYVTLATAKRDRRMTSVTAKINRLVDASDAGDVTADEFFESTAPSEYRS